MLTNSKIVLAVALIFATGSAALAAPKHTVRPATGIERQVPANAYLSFGSVRPTNSASEPSNVKIQDIGFKENLGG